MHKPLLLTTLALTLCLTLPDASFAKGKGKGKGGGGNPDAQAAKQAARQYDTNQNGTIDGAEVEAIQKAFESSPTGPLKVYDTNNDGKLDNSEVASISLAGGKGGKKGKKGKKDAGSPTTAPATSDSSST